jgi:gliding motility-associated-like protein
MLIIPLASKAQCTSPLLNWKVTAHDLLCNNDNSGSIEVEVIGSFADYTYSLFSVVSGPKIQANFNSNKYTFSNLPADDNYFLVIQVPLGNGAFAFCTQIVELKEPPAIVINPVVIIEPMCSNATDGSIDINVNGGLGPYSYNWNTGITTQDISNIGVGNYSVNIIDQNGCPKDSTFSLTQPLPIDIQSNIIEPTCNGLINGSIDITINNAHMPYTFTWSNGNLIEDLTNISAGSYILNVVDKNNCTASSNFTINEPLALISTQTNTNSICSGSNNGTASISISGGTTPYTYLWNTGNTSSSITNLAPGNYSVTTTDANNCSVINNFTITEPAPINDHVNISNINCFGGSTGAISINPSGGNAGYTYIWNTSETSSNLSNKPIGSYSVEIKDNKNCIANFNYNITQNPQIEITETIIDPLCNGNSTGSINNIISGGFGSYTYLWSHGATTMNLTSLTAGNYQLEVTDQLGCKQIKNYTLSNPPILQATLSPQDLTCNASSNGSINSSVSGGTSPYSYSWSNGSSTANLSGLSAGSYTLIVTDNNGCTSNVTSTLNQPNVLSIVLNPTNPKCNTSNDGSIISIVNGGTTPYSYSWNNGNMSAVVTGISSGNYTLTVTDKNNCTASQSTIITAPAEIFNNTTISNVTCFNSSDGSIISTTNGGTIPYSYAWNTGTITKDLINVKVGNYSLTITDQNNCQKTFNYIVTEPTKLTTMFSSTLPLCNGYSNGSITSNTSGGTSPYSYIWSTGYNGGNQLTNIPSNTYTLTITDKNNCSLDTTYTLANQPAPTITSNISNPTCNGLSNGSILLSVNGISSYTYLWNNGNTSQNLVNITAGNYSVNITDLNSCTYLYNYTVIEPTILTINSNVTTLKCNGNTNGEISVSVSGGVSPYTYSWSNGSNSNLINNLSAGTYTINVFDQNNCMVSKNILLSEPSKISIYFNGNTPTCVGISNGSISSSVSGGTLPYIYQWNTGATTTSLSNLSSGTYNLSITDANNCLINKDTIISAPVLVIGSATANSSTLCVNQTTDITALFNIGNPATPGYSFDNGLTFINNNTFTTPPISNDTIVYIVLKDQNGCTSLPIGVPISTNSFNTIFNPVVSATCSYSANGSITVVPSGSANAFTYSIDNQTFQNSNTFNNLTTGNHTVKIDNGLGCISSHIVIVPSPLDIVSTIKNYVPVTLCKGNSNGELLISSIGGVPAYSYKLINTGLIQTDSLFKNLSAGLLKFEITDQNSCKDTVLYTITEPLGIDTLAIIQNNINPLCAGKNEGVIELKNVTGGTSPYNYTLNNIGPISTPYFDKLLAGSYAIKITDANNCSLTMHTSLTSPPPILFTAIINSSPTCTNIDGEIAFLNESGGTPPYLYSIDDGINYDTKKTYNNLPTGIYPTRIKDVNSCTASYLLTVNKKPDPIPYIHFANPTCIGLNDGYIIVDSIDSKTGPYFYTFNNKARGGTTNFTQLTAGDYSIKIEDANCVHTTQVYYVWNTITLKYDTLKNDTVQIKNPNIITADQFQTTATFGNNDANVGFTNFKGGLPNYHWSIDNHIYNPIQNDTLILNNYSQGNYSIYFKDSNDCVVSYNFEVLNEFKIPNLITPNNDGKNDRFEVLSLPMNSELKITNRWGDTIYKSDNYDNSWDGDELTDGIYYYTLTLPNDANYKGWIEIIR